MNKTAHRGPAEDRFLHRRRADLLKLLGLATAVALTVLVLRQFPPDQHPFYPRCLFHALTGWDCPGCGGLRATHQLLHGHLRAALELNPLLPLFLVLIGYFSGAWLYRFLTGRHLPAWARHAGWAWGVAALLVMFGIARNLPAPWLAKLGWVW